MPPKVDLSQTLAPDLYNYLLQTLRTTLPPPPDDTPEARAERDNCALAQIASLNPATYIEVDLALQIVLLLANAKDCLRWADDPSLSASMSLKCHAQSAAMRRESQSTLKFLLREQKRREKAQSIPKSERSEQDDRRFVAMMERVVAEMYRADQAEAERRSLEQRLRTVAPCFIHQPGDPKRLN